MASEEKQHVSGSVEPGDTSQRILREEMDHEAWFIELLSMERDGEVNPAGHFVRGEPGDAPYSENNPFNESA